MKKGLATLLFCLHLLVGFAQTDSSKSITLLLVPYQPMMYFSDADQHIAQQSSTTEQNVRNSIRTKLENQTWHKLLAHFNVVSLLNSTSLNGEEDLKKIYAATTHYYLKPAASKKNYGSGLFNNPTKERSYSTTDSSVMVAEVLDKNLFKELNQKHKQQYVVYFSQFEVTTSNKNTIEWLKNKYSRTYGLHYCVWNNQGELILAETINLLTDGANKLNEITDKQLPFLAECLTEILSKKLK